MSIGAAAFHQAEMALDSCGLTASAFGALPDEELVEIARAAAPGCPHG